MKAPSLGHDIVVFNSDVGLRCGMQERSVYRCKDHFAILESDNEGGRRRFVACYLSADEGHWQVGLPEVEMEARRPESTVSLTRVSIR